MSYFYIKMSEKTCQKVPRWGAGKNIFFENRFKELLNFKVCVFFL